MGKPGIKLVLGALAGFLAFMIMEPSAPTLVASSRWEIWGAWLVSLLGIFIGLTIGGYNGYLQGSKSHLLIGLLLGGIFGLAGISLGARIGEGLMAPFHGKEILAGSGSILLRIPIRILALTPVGIFLGLGIGASSLNIRRAIMGAVGGLIGGAIGAILFDPVSDMFGPLVVNLRGATGVTEVGIFGRALYCILLGAGVGLFVGLVENYAKTAWLRLSLGRNEGREWFVDGPLTVIGRGEMCQVPLFGDSAVAPRHATIARNGDQYILTDENSPSGTYVNGQRITQVPLFHGAMIQIGSYGLQFLMKVGQAPINAGEMLRAQQHFAMAPQGSGAPVGMAPFQPSVPAAVMPAVAPTVAMPNVPFPQSVPTQVMTPQPIPAPAAPAAPMSGPVLVATTGPLSGQRFPIGANLEVGREAPGITLSFDTGASRRHASFMATPGGIILTDLGSTNGTFVNDQPVQAATISKGDTVRIGVTTFRVE